MEGQRSVPDTATTNESEAANSRPPPTRGLLHGKGIAAARRRRKATDLEWLYGRRGCARIDQLRHDVGHQGIFIREQRIFYDAATPQPLGFFPSQALKFQG